MTDFHVPKEFKTRQYDIAAVMALSGLRYWECNASKEFQARTARILTNMLKENPDLINRYLDLYCLDVQKNKVEGLPHKEFIDDLSSEKLPRRQKGW